jgi:hypothetical protein
MMTAAAASAGGGDTPRLVGAFGCTPAAPTPGKPIGGNVGPGAATSGVALAVAPTDELVAVAGAWSPAGVSDGLRVLAISQAESSTRDRTRGASFRMCGKD